jgi:hypothetical protein
MTHFSEAIVEALLLRGDREDERLFGRYLVHITHSGTWRT